MQRRSTIISRDTRITDDETKFPRPYNFSRHLSVCCTEIWYGLGLRLLWRGLRFAYLSSDQLLFSIMKRTLSTLLAPDGSLRLRRFKTATHAAHTAAAAVSFSLPTN